MSHPVQSPSSAASLSFSEYCKQLFESAAIAITADRSVATYANVLMEVHHKATAEMHEKNWESAFILFARVGYIFEHALMGKKQQLDAIPNAYKYAEVKEKVADSLSQLEKLKESPRLPLVHQRLVAESVERQRIRERSGQN